MLRKRLVKRDQIPEIPPGLELHWLAFNEMSTCRVDGGPIPWTAIRDWCAHADLGAVDSDRLRTILRRLDTIWLSKQKEERDKRLKQNKKPFGHGKRRQK